MSFRYCGFADEARKDLDGQIEIVKACGWSAIELRAMDASHVCDLADAEWEAARRKLADNGITIVGFGGQIANWSRPITSDFRKDIDELQRVAPRMKEVGCKFLRVMSYPNDEHSPLSDKDWKTEAFRRLKELATMAEGLGVILAHENCSGYGSRGPLEYREMMQAVDSPALRPIFDTGNSGIDSNDHEATWRYYQACRDEIVHVHIKSGQPDADGRLVTCYPDEDPMQARVLSDLKARGYDGYLSIEPHLHAAIHAGREAADAEAAGKAWIDYAARLEKLVSGL